MSKNYQVGLVITGDAKGGVKAAKLTSDQLEQLNKKQKRTQQQSKATGSAFADMGTKLAVVTGLVASATAVLGGLTAMMRTEAIREVDNLSRSLGVSTETLTEWQYAAERVGLQTDKLGDIFKDVQDKIGDFAATGGGEAADIFENLGLSIEKVNGLAPDKQLLAIADALDEVGSRSEKIFYLESIADDASRLLPLLENGAAGLKEMQQEARQLGVSLDQVDAAKVTEAANQMAAVRGIVTGLSNQFTVAVAPVLLGISEQLREGAIEAGNMDDNMQGIVGTTISVVGLFRDMYRVVEIAGKGIGALAFEFEQDTKEMALFAAKFGTAFEGVWLQAKINILETLDDLLAGFANKVNSMIELANKAPLVNINPISFDKFDTAELKRQLQVNLNSIKAYEGEQEKLAASVRDAWKDVHDLILEPMPSDNIEAWYKQLKTRINQLAEAQAEATEKTRKFGSENNRVGKDAAKNADDYKKAWEQAFDRIGREFSDGWLNLIEGKSTEVFDGILDGFKRMLAEMLHLAITRPIVLNIQSALGMSGAGVSGLLGGVGQLGGGLGGLLGLAGFGAMGSGGLLGGLGGLAGGAGLLSSAGLLPGVFGAGFGGTTALLGAGSMSGAMAHIGGLFGSGSIMGGLGAALPIAGLVAGGLGLVNSITGGGLFGTSYKPTGQDLELGISGGNVTGSTILEESKKKSFFRGTRRRETETPFDTTAINDIFDSVEMSIIDAAEALNIDSVEQTITRNLGGAFDFANGRLPQRIVELMTRTVNVPVEQWLDDFSRTMKIDISDMSEEEVQAAIAEWTQQTTDAMINGVFGGFLTDLKREGEASSDALIRVVNNMQAMSSIADKLNLQFDVTGKAAAIAATNIVDMVGGLDSLNALTTTYYNEFFSQAEQFGQLTDDLSNAFADLGKSLPDSRDQFRAMVESIDLTTTKGQELYASLMQLSPAMAQYFNVLENQPELLEELAEGAEQLTDAERRLLEQRQAFIDNIEQQLTRGELSGMDLELFDLRNWYQNQIDTAEELGADTQLLEILYGRKRQDVIQKYHDQLLADHQRSVDALTSEYDRLFSTMNSVASAISNNMLSIRRSMPGWDEAGYQSGVITSLRSRLGQGSATEQVGVIEQLMDATMARYQAEIDRNNQLQNAAEERYQAELANYERIKDLVESIKQTADDLLLSDLAPLKQGEQFDIAQSQFQSLLAQAKTGDESALSQLSGAGQGYLKIAQDYFASGSAEYSAIFDQVQQGLRSVTAGNGPSSINAATQRYQQDNIALQESALAELADLQLLLDQLNAEAEQQLDTQLGELQVSFEQSQAEIVAAEQQQISQLESINQNLIAIKNTPPPPPVVVTIPAPKEPKQPQPVEPRPDPTSQENNRAVVAELQTLNREVRRQNQALRDTQDQVYRLARTASV